MSNPFYIYAESLSRRIPSAFVWPTITAQSDEEEGDEDILSSNVLHKIVYGAGVPTTFWISAPGGHGKTTLAAAFASQACMAARPCLVLEARQFSIAAASTDAALGASHIQQFAFAAKPNEIFGDKEWRGIIDKARLVIVIDGVAEIQRSNDLLATKILNVLLFGRHPFSVVAFSRLPPSDEQIDASFRAISNITIRAFDDQGRRDYLKKYGLNPDEAIRHLRSAGLEAASSSPLVLSLGARLIRAGEGALPNSRADLFLATLQHPERTLNTAERLLLERPPGLGSLAATAAAIGFANGDNAFTRSELDDLQKQTWKNNDAEKRTDLLLASYLVEPAAGHNRYMYSHPSFTEFGIALTLSSRDPERWPITAGLENYIGDWCGLQDRLDGAAVAVSEVLRDCGRPDLYVDLLIANYGKLPKSEIVEIWRRLNIALHPHQPRAFRDGIVRRLVELPIFLRRDSLRFGDLFGAGSGWSADDGEWIRRALVAGILSPGALTKLKRRASRNNWRRAEPAARRVPVSGPEAEEVHLTDCGELLAVALDESQDAALRRRCIHQLAELDDSSAAQALQEAMNIKSPDVRSSVAGALSELSSSIVAALTKALKTGSDEKRECAASALGKIRDQSTVQDLIEALEDPSALVRNSAAHALGRMSAVSAASSLVSLLKDDDYSVRGAAARAIREIRANEAVSYLIAFLAEMDVGTIEDVPERARGRAATALGVIGNPEAVQQLCHILLHDKSEKVRGKAAHALGLIGSNAAVPALCSVLRSESTRIQRSSAMALERIGDARAVEACLDLALSGYTHASDPNGTAITTQVPGWQETVARTSALNSAISLSDKLPQPIEDAFRTKSISRWPDGLLGALMTQLPNKELSEDCVAWLKGAAIHDNSPAHRTQAIQILQTRGRFEDSMVNRLINPLARLDLRTARDTDWGVQGVAVAVVVKQFAHGGSPNASVLGAAIELLADPTTNSSVHKAGLRPLSAVLEISDARRALAAISTSAVVQEGSTLRRVISDHQRRIERKAGDERDIATFRAKPELLLIDLFRRDQPRYKTERTMPKVWKDAALIAANEREGQTLYEELIKHAATPTLERVRLSGSTVGFRGTVVHDEGGRRNVTLVVIADTGPKAAAAVIPDILDSGPLGILLFVGCAGEISEKHRSSTTKRLVIVARQVVDRDPSVVAPSGLKFGMRGYPASDELLRNLCKSPRSDR